MLALGRKQSGKQANRYLHDARSRVSEDRKTGGIANRSPPVLPSAYRGDDNALLKASQAAFYESQALATFYAARKALAFADELLGAQLHITETVWSMDGIDRHVLMDAWAILAAWYRYDHDDCGQLELWPQFPIEDRYQVEWNTWFYKCLDDLVTMPSFVRNIVDTAAFANTDYGRLAQHQLCFQLLNYCCVDDWAPHGDYAERYPPLPEASSRTPKSSREAPPQCPEPQPPTTNSEPADKATAKGAKPTYEIHVLDNYYCPNSFESYRYGTYTSAEQAIHVARDIVDGCLNGYYQVGMSAEDLYKHYILFGDDPMISTNDQSIEFSAWDYAKQRSDEKCQ